MQGFVRQRGNRWQVIVNAGKDPITGKRRTRSGTAATKKEAMALRNRLITEMGTAPEVGTDATMAELFEEYMACAGPPSQNSRYTYTQAWTRWLEPAIGAVPARKLRGADLNRVYAAMRDEGLKPSYVRKVHTVASAMCSYAVKNDWLVINPARNASPPHVPRTVVRATPLSDIARILEAIDGTHFGLFIFTSAALGTRRGETLGIQWGDVNFSAGELTIRRRVKQIPGGTEVVDFTKTDSARTIAVDAATLERLRARLMEVQANIALVDGALPPSAFVFTNDHDLAGVKPWHPSSVTHQITRVSRRLGLEGVHLHGLRHHVATSLVSAGVDARTVAERLGNSADVVLKVYSHFVPASDRAASDLLGGLLSSPRQDVAQPGT